MSQIRLPRTLGPFLRLCRPHADKLQVPVFETYAHLIVFAAARGFQYARAVPESLPRAGAPPPPFLDQPAAISYDIFRNQRLRPVLLMMAIAHSGHTAIASDSDAICRLAEAYAALGGEVLIGGVETIDLGTAGRLADALLADGSDDGKI